MKKEIIISETNGKTSFSTEGFTSFEIIGIFNYFRDEWVVRKMQQGFAAQSAKAAKKGKPKKTQP
jgi:hypothetical protein